MGQHDLRPIFDNPRHTSMPGGGQKWLIFRVIIRQLWQASSRAGNQPGNHFMRHITSQYMGQHDLRPFLTTQAIHLCQEGVKNGSFFRSKSGHYGRPVPGQGTNLETILCAISPPNTWDSMILDHLFRVVNRLETVFCAISIPRYQSRYIIHSNHCLFKSLFRIQGRALNPSQEKLSTNKEF